MRNPAKILLQFFFLTAGVVVMAFGENENATVNQLSPAEVKIAWEKLNGLIQKSGGIDPTELERARLQGVLERLGKNARIKKRSPADEIAIGTSFRMEMLPRSILYARLGDLTNSNVSQFRDTLRKNASANAVILDLRVTGGEADYELAANLIGLFAGGGKNFFTLTRGGTEPGKSYSSQDDALFTGVVLILINEDTGGAAETVAAAMRQQVHALTVGKKTTGLALEFTALPLNDNLMLEVATGRIVLPGAAPGFLENGLVPDLPVATNIEEEREILSRSDKEGIALFLFEIESPHMNEASLVAGKNPELDAYQARKADKNKNGERILIDRSLQRALDTVTSLLVLRGTLKTGS